MEYKLYSSFKILFLFYFFIFGKCLLKCDYDDGYIPLYKFENETQKACPIVGEYESRYVYKLECNQNPNFYNRNIKFLKNGTYFIDIVDSYSSGYNCFNFFREYRESGNWKWIKYSNDFHPFIVFNAIKRNYYCNNDNNDSHYQILPPFSYTLPIIFSSNCKILYYNGHAKKLYNYKNRYKHFFRHKSEQFTNIKSNIYNNYGKFSCFTPINDKFVVGRYINVLPIDLKCEILF